MSFVRWLNCQVGVDKCYSVSTFMLDPWDINTRYKGTQTDNQKVFAWRGIWTRNVIARHVLENHKNKVFKLNNMVVWWLTWGYGYL